MLTEEQTACIMTAANAVPPSWRDRFLSLCADRLLGQPLTDATISSAANDVRFALLAGMPDDD